MRKQLPLVLASAILVPLVMGATQAEPRTVQHLTILHTTDLHGQIEPHLEYEWPNGPQAAPRVWRAGGLAHLKTLFDRIRAEQPGRTLIVDTGDTFQGSAIAALSEGKVIPPLMNMLGYNVMLPGNWEVVYGPHALVSLMKQYAAPTVTSNLFDEASGKPVFPPYIVKTVNGVRIGILGYTDHFVKTRQSPAYSAGLRYTEPVATVQADVKQLRQQEHVDVVLALGHLGLAQQVWLADQPGAQGIDFLLGGDALDTLCRLRGARDPRVHVTTIHEAMAAFFQKHSPVTPRFEQRAKAVDLPSTLRTQGGAPDYDFW